MDDYLSNATLTVSEMDSNQHSNVNSNMSLPLRLESRAVVTSATMFTVGVLGNLVAIVVLYISKKEQKETTFYTLVCGMAITDLLGTCFTSPVVIATYVTNRWPGGELLCHFFSFSMLFFGSAGMSILCAMAVERYLAINHAYFYSHYVDRTMARLTLVATYLANIVLCVMPSFGFGKHIRHFPGTWCFLDWRATEPLAASYSFVYGGFMLMLIGVTVSCNFAVCRSLVLMSQRRRIVRAESSGHGGSERRFPKLSSVSSAAEIQMFWLLIFMTIVFLVCSIPLVVRIFVNQLYGPAHISAGGKPDYRSDLLAIRFASFNPILDPWVYILCRKNLLIKGCENVKRIFGKTRKGHTRKKGRVSGQHTPPSYTPSNTSYASLRTGNDKDDEQVVIRTKSFTDFTVQQTWDFDASRPNFHPFSVVENAIISETCTRGASKTFKTKPILSSITQESPVHVDGGEAHSACDRRHGGQLEIVTCTFSSPSSCISEKCI
ncbi:prostaglandin E2 receptor EP4 subtype-like [Megalops cyprinoides]|uniref:prostaglandin E2 receptor EP4 subtype-like n=1 Tax=Megalops cyprinoides TaxID=118141 RepID=UPI00186524BA|nr:prostaglandin E2 receptor EP4 subtype-like [Megalops cyprinoides]